MDIAEQIIGGLYLELKERFSRYPEYWVELGEIFGESAVRFNTVHCMVDDGKIKVISADLTNFTPNSHGSLAWMNRVLSRCILYEYSIVEPDADFGPLFEFLDSYHKLND